MSNLNIIYTTTESGGEAYDPGDRWTSYEPTYIDTTFKYATIGGDGGKYSDGVASDIDWQPGDTACVVVATYSDGDTFKTTIGYVQFMGAYKSIEEAAALKSALEKLDSKTFSFKWHNPPDTELYIPWAGYFSGLSDITIQVLPVV